MKNSSETGMKEFRFQKKRDKCETFKKKFKEWFVGYTDGDGCFNIYLNEKSEKITLTFKISQKGNNEQVLHYMKKELGVGKVRKDKLGMAHYLIRDQKGIEEKVIPLFEEYQLRTEKRYSYEKYLESYKVWKDTESSQREKILKIKNIIESTEKVERKKNPKEMTKSWIIGFTEAEGSFYLTSKDKERIEHGFGITQKKDREVLQEIKEKLEIKPEVRWNKKGFWTLDTTNKECIKKIKRYYTKTMKSRKSLIYRIWARSLRHKNKYPELRKIQELLRSLK